MFLLYRPLVEEIVKKETKKNEKQVSLDGKELQKLKGRITRSNSLPSIFSPAINQLRGKIFENYFVIYMIYVIIK